jgi:hypothetical protein
MLKDFQRFGKIAVAVVSFGGPYRDLTMGDAWAGRAVERDAMQTGANTWLKKKVFERKNSEDSNYNVYRSTGKLSAIYGRISESRNPTFVLHSCVQCRLSVSTSTVHLDYNLQLFSV